MEEKSVVSRRGRTYYWIERTDRAGAKNLVFLPGLTADHRLFGHQLRYFAGKHTILTWDAPGHGKSRPYSDFSYAHLAQELRAVLDREGLERAVLVGQSAGGFVSQSLIALCPERVEGLLTIGTCPYGPAYYSGSDLFWLRQTRWMLRAFPSRLLRGAMARMCGATAQARENMLQMLACYGKKELCRLMYLGFAGFIPEMRELEIPCPVCLVVGEKDRTGKVKKYNQRWHEREGYPLYLVKGASHNANADRPGEVNRIIEVFLDGQTGEKEEQTGGIEA